MSYHNTKTTMSLRAINDGQTASAEMRTVSFSIF
jgi:hypothetical protein